MSVDIYPATINGNNIEPKNNWDDETTMNLANGNFYTFAEALMGEAKGAPGFWNTKEVRKRIVMILNSDKPADKLLINHPYIQKLMKIVVWAEENNAEIIAYA